MKYVYFHHNDDQPYPMRVDGKTLIVVPLCKEITDHGLYNRNRFTPEEAYNVYKEYFDVLYEESAESGRMMTIGAHPHVTGMPFRIRTYDRILSYIERYKDVWFTTKQEVADWYLGNYLNQ